MIGREQLNEAARNVNALAEELGLPGWAERDRTDLDGLKYLAEQRALRAAYLIIDGGDPRELQTREFKTIPLSEKAKEMLPALTATFMDGYATGREVKDPDLLDGKRRFK